jgi:hypothetical protein
MTMQRANERNDMHHASSQYVRAETAEGVHKNPFEGKSVHRAL